MLVGVTVRTLEVGRSDGVTSTLSSIARRPGSRRLRLRGLDQGDSGELVARTAGRPVPDEVAAAIHARSGGNPFFAGELVRLLIDEEMLGDPAAVSAAPVPAGVRDVLRRRLDRLPEGTIDLLRIAAVIGRDLELPVMASAAGWSVDDCADALEPAVAQRLLADAPTPPATARFAHALVREVLVEDMTSLRRARLHLRAADALLAHASGDESAELVAEHLWAATPLGVGERAAEALERAAEVALRRAAFATAEDLLRRALSLRANAGATDGHVAAELATLMTLAGVTRSLHGFPAFSALAGRAKDLARRLGADHLIPDIEWGEWAAADTACDFATGDPIAERFRERARAADPDDAVTHMLGQVVWGITCWHHGRVTEANACLEAGRTAIARLPTAAVPTIVSEQRLLAEAFSIHVHDLVGDLPDVERAYEALVRSQEDRFARAMVAGFQSSAAVTVGDIARVGRSSRAGLAADPDVAFSFWGSQNQMYAAVADATEGGDLDDAIGLFEDGHARYRIAGTRTGLGVMYAAMALALSGRDDVDRARGYVGRAWAELEARRERWPEPVILLAEADVTWRSGDGDDEVATLLDQAEALATEQGSLAVARRMALARDRMIT